MINTYDLDDAIDDGKADQYVGQPVIWHFGYIGTVQKIKSGEL